QLQDAPFYRPAFLYQPLLRGYIPFRHVRMGRVQPLAYCLYWRASIALCFLESTRILRRSAKGLLGVEMGGTVLLLNARYCSSLFLLFCSIALNALLIFA